MTHLEIDIQFPTGWIGPKRDDSIVRAAPSVNATKRGANAGLLLEPVAASAKVRARLGQEHAKRA